MVTFPGWATSPARRLGYRVFGPRLAWLLHLRPAEWPIMAAHTALGYALAVGFGGMARGAALGQAALAVALWVVCLNGGTLALNSAFDRDQGDIGYLRNPPPAPRGLFGFGLLLMLAGQGASLVLPLQFTWAYAVCFLLSVLYSVPPFRLKAVAGADWVINMWGFGTLTPYAGWASTGLPVSSAGLLVLLAFCPLFAALYPLTQLYQMEEDQRRGDRTLARVLGVSWSLNIAIAATLFAFGLLAWAGNLASWGPSPWRWVVLVVALLGWLAVLLPWRARGRHWSPRAHQRGMYLALGAWGVTDLAVLLAFA